MSNVDRREAKQRLGRELFLLVLMAGLLLIMFFRVAYIKGVHGAEYQKMAEQQQVNSTDVRIPALRGSIYDRNGNVLAESVRVYNVILDCQTLIDASPNKQLSTCDQLVATLGLKDDSSIREYMTEEYHEYRYKKLPTGQKISGTQMEEIQQAIDRGRVVGVWFEEDEIRTYTNDTLAAHVLGFNGKYGIEQYYNDYLQGMDGRKMVVAGTGNSFVEEYMPESNGKNLTTTIDEKVQFTIEQILANAVRENNALRGACALMDCTTGAIISMAVVPTFNCNDVTEVYGLTDRYKQEYPDEEDPDYYAYIWSNYLLNTTYEAGSTFKPMFAAAALNEGYINSYEVFVCTGEYHIYDASVFCHNGGIHGSETVEDILQNSCNCGMAMISMRFPLAKWLDYQDAYGIGYLTGVDLAGEVGDYRGLVFTSRSEAERLGTGNAMGVFEKATTAFGQGFKMTPLQLLCAFTSVINGGEYLKPYVVSEITDEFGNVVASHNKEVLRHTISERVSAEIRDYLFGLVEYNYARPAHVDGYLIGGKTGTAEKLGDDGQYLEGRYIVSFVSFVPVDNPKYTMILLIDEPEDENSTPVIETTGTIWEAILPALGLYPDPSLIGYENTRPSLQAYYADATYGTKIDMEEEDPDTDGDGIPNKDDRDIDGDGIPNNQDEDMDGDGIPNTEDGDMDGDGRLNNEDGDVDGDGIPNLEDDDMDGDGIPNDQDDDKDGDGIPNYMDDYIAVDDDFE